MLLTTVAPQEVGDKSGCVTHRKQDGHLGSGAGWPSIVLCALGQVDSSLTSPSSVRIKMGGSLITLRRRQDGHTDRKQDGPNVGTPAACSRTNPHGHP